MNYLKITKDYKRIFNDFLIRNRDKYVSVLKKQLFFAKIN